MEASNIGNFNLPDTFSVNRELDGKPLPRSRSLNDLFQITITTTDPRSKTLDAIPIDRELTFSNPTSELKDPSSLPSSADETSKDDPLAKQFSKRKISHRRHKSKSDSSLLPKGITPRANEEFLFQANKIPEATVDEVNRGLEYKKVLKAWLSLSTSVDNKHYLTRGGDNELALKKLPPLIGKKKKKQEGIKNFVNLVKENKPPVNTKSLTKLESQVIQDIAQNPDLSKAGMGRDFRGVVSTPGPIKQNPLPEMKKTLADLRKSAEGPKEFAAALLEKPENTWGEGQYATEVIGYLLTDDKGNLYPGGVELTKELLCQSVKGQDKNTLFRQNTLATKILRELLLRHPAVSEGLDSVFAETFTFIEEHRAELTPQGASINSSGEEREQAHEVARRECAEQFLTQTLSQILSWPEEVIEIFHYLQKTIEHELQVGSPIDESTARIQALNPLFLRILVPRLQKTATKVGKLVQWYVNEVDSVAEMKASIVSLLNNGSLNTLYGQVVAKITGERGSSSGSNHSE